MGDARQKPTERNDAFERVRAVAEAQYDFLWRCLRRLGVQESEVEDAAQQVLLVLMRRIGVVQVGAERAFLFGTAVRVAREFRKRTARARAREDVRYLDREQHPGAAPDLLLDEHRARRLLDAVLDELPEDLRAVLVLADLEELTMAETAELLAIPPGTVASRLRRAREVFAERAAALKERLGGDRR